MKRKPTGTSGFHSSAKKVHPTNSYNPMRGGIRL